MSSGPSQLCLYGNPSGTILLSIISISSLTSGSQLSFNAKLADVCSTENKNFMYHLLIKITNIINDKIRHR